MVTRTPASHHRQFSSHLSKSSSKTAASLNPYTQPQSMPDLYTHKTNLYSRVTKRLLDQSPSSVQSVPPPLRYKDYYNSATSRDILYSRYIGVAAATCLISPRLTKRPVAG